MEPDGTPCLCDVTVNGLTFDANFDSGNATRVEPVTDAENEFCLWTRRDAEGTPHENGCRTWFAFSVRGLLPGMTYAFRMCAHGSNNPLLHAAHGSCQRPIDAAVVLYRTQTQCA